MGNDWDGGDDEPKMTLVDTGTMFVSVPAKQGPPTPTREHEYERSNEKPRKMHTDPPCVCGEPKKSPVHL